METVLALRRLDLLVDERCHRLVRLLQQQTKFAAIAGGYLRDRYFQVPAKDIDIFASADFDAHKFLSVLNGDWALSLGDGEWTVTETAAPEHPIEDQARKSPPVAQFQVVCDEYADEDDTTIRVFNFRKENWRELVQVIVSGRHTSLAEVLSGFDFGICQIGFEGYRPLVTDYFWCDAANYCGTFLLDKPREHHRQHAARIARRYPKLQWLWHSKDG